MAAAQPSTSGRHLFKQLESLPVPCQYTLSLMNFIINNQENLQTNLSTSKDKLSCFKKSTFYAGINIFNSLPCSLTILNKGEAKFKVAI